MAEKEHLNLVFIGHVDHGKSTLVGRFLYDTGSISQQDMKKYEEEAKAKGKESFVFAYVMDTTEEERKRGVTIDLAYKKFETQKHSFTIIDAPGHQDFVKNMITGPSQADAAVLVCSIAEGIQEQTREHAQLAKVLGVPQILVAVNKMDTANFDKAKFDAYKVEIEKLMATTGFKDVKIVPVSAWTGDNVAKKTEKMSWWAGGSLLDNLDSMKAPPRANDKPLRLPIQDVYTIKGVGTVPVGRVETGVLKPNMQAVIMPAGKIVEVKTVEAHHQQLPQAGPGENIGFNLRGAEKSDLKRGDMLGDPKNPPTVAEEFTAQIVILKHPTGIAAGYTPVFHVHTAQIACTFSQLLEKLDPKTGAVVEKNPTFLKNGDVAKVVIKPMQPLCIEKASDYPHLGRFAIRDMGKTVAAGIVLDIKPKQVSAK